jgi:hypothetical protein
MSPVSPVDIVERSFSGKTWLVQSRIMISRTFQKELSNLAMGRFISFAGNNLTNADLIDKLYEGLLKAYTYFVGLSFILNYAGEWIYHDPLLKVYFSQFEMTKEYFKLREAEGWKQYQSGDWSFYRDWVLSHMGYDKSLYDKFNPRESLLNVERYKCARVQDLTNSEALSKLQICQLIGNACAPASAATNFFYIQPEGVPLVSVFIGLDVTILFANIYLMEVYRALVTNGLKNGHIPASLAFQSAHISENNVDLAKLYFDKSGTLKFTIPADINSKRKVTLNTFALKTTLDLSKVLMERYSLEPWDLESNAPPALQLVIGEPWDLESNAPPDMQLVIGEPWDAESSIPTAMALTVMEYWGTASPTMAQARIEYWGKIPPVFYQKLFETWAS